MNRVRRGYSENLSSVSPPDPPPRGDAARDRSPPIARIDERACIGCTLCLAVCPVDAIVGAAKLMHTVLADRCTGCELCLPPCPVDCIALVAGTRPWSRADAEAARVRELARERRLARRSGRGDAAAQTDAPSTGDLARAQRRAAIEAALARARARRAARRPPGPRP